MAYTPHAVNLSRVEEIIDIMGIFGIKRIIVVKYDKGSNMHNVHNHGAAPLHADGLDKPEATMEGVLHGPAASEVLMSEEAVVRPLQKCLEDHCQEQLSNISENHISHFVI